MPTALVLSAGGLFAAYQAGAWKTLAGSFTPDLVVGASAGALNAWAIAGGCDPDALIADWLDPAVGDLMRFRFPTPTLFDPAPLIRHVDLYFGRYTPRIPFALTMVEVPRLRRVCVPGDRVTPAHLRATCAIPFCYPPARIEGKLYVDGGLLDVVPLWAAAELGATRAIVLNALPFMPSVFMRLGVGLVRAVGPSRPFSKLEVIEVRPSGALGSIRDALGGKPETIQKWILQGEQDAREAINRVAAPRE